MKLFYRNNLIKQGDKALLIWYMKHLLRTEKHNFVKDYFKIV